MPFLTERLFQMLEKHKIYEKLNSAVALAYFLERHVICAWGYNSFMRSLQRDLVASLQPINSEVHKEAVRLIAEIMLEEEVEDLGNGRLTSHLELYLDAMQDLGCDMGPILTFFDLLEEGLSPNEALRIVPFAKETRQYGEMIAGLLKMPIHVRAVALFYEGEPFIPDCFLKGLYGISASANTAGLLNYFERHIEGLKTPGFSAAGRLIEVLCSVEEKLTEDVDKASEQILNSRLSFWNSICAGIEKNGLNVISKVAPFIKPHLRLVR